MAEQLTENPNRRSFISSGFFWLTALVGLFASLAASVPLIGFFLGPIRRRESPWVPLGATNKFPVNETRMETFNNPLGLGWDGMTAHTGVYVRNLGKDAQNQEQFLIFAVNCAHLGCPVEWFPQSGLFMCPCHGGVYYENGERASGPPPRGLFHCVWRVNGDQLEVQAPFFPTLHNTLKRGSA